MKDEEMMEDEKIAPVHEAGHFLMQVIAHGVPPRCTMLYAEDDGECWWLDREEQPEKSLLICVAGFAAIAYNTMLDKAEYHSAAQNNRERFE